MNRISRSRRRLDDVLHQAYRNSGKLPIAKVRKLLAILEEKEGQE